MFNITASTMASCLFAGYDDDGIPDNVMQRLEEVRLDRIDRSIEGVHVVLQPTQPGV